MPPISSEVKGVWFAAARRYLLEQQPEAMDEVLAFMNVRYRDALENPLASEWYPEAALQEMLRALFHVLAKNDVERAIDIIDRTTELAISRFFRTLMELGSPEFVLRGVPTMWSRVRRNAGAVSVEIEGRRATVSYKRFPYFDDPVYRHLVVGSLRALVRIASGKTPKIDIVSHSPSALTAVVDFS